MNFFLFIELHIHFYLELGAPRSSDQKYEPLSNNSKQTVSHVIISWNSTGEPFGLMCPDFSVNCPINITDSYEVEPKEM